MKQSKVVICGALTFLVLFISTMVFLPERPKITTETGVIDLIFPTTLSTPTEVAGTTDGESTTIITTTAKPTTTITTTTKVETTKNEESITETVMPKVVTTTNETTTKATTAAYIKKNNLTALQNEIYGYVLAVCKQYPDVKPSMVMAIIERESNFDRYAVNYNGTCFGLMQIYVYYNQSRMNRLGVTNIYDAYGNILVGVDLLSELYHSYGNWEGAFRQYSGGMNSYYPWVLNRMPYYE